MIPVCPARGPVVKTPAPQSRYDQGSGMKRTALWVAALFAVAWQRRLPQARLGETPRALQARYGGVDFDERKLGDFTHCQYQKQGFVMDIYFLDGKSVMEIFVKRGLSPDEAGMLVAKVAGSGPPRRRGRAKKIRQVSGISCRDELFWSWKAGNPPGPVIAGFNPLECTEIFFGDPAIYARLQKAMAGQDRKGSGLHQ